MARGLAFLGKGKMDDAEKELTEVRRIAADKALEFPLFSPNLGSTIFAIAPEVLAGEIAAARKEWDPAIRHLERAVRLEDGLVYTEPAEWHYPPRHALGAVLLAAGRAKEAETVYWEDLQQHPDNGEVLYYYGIMMIFKNRADEALKLFERATQVDPEYPNAYYAAYSLLHDMGQPERGRQIMEQWLNRHPDDARARAILGRQDGVPLAPPPTMPNLP